ncbi:MAG: PLP-dependent aminotransferase family protein [Pseudomonadota bacterium]
MDTKWQPTLSDHPGPKYKALADALKDGIRAGALPAGSRLPPVRDLAWKLSITPGTVARAYTMLTDTGLCEATVGRGTFVAQSRISSIHDPIFDDSVPHGTGGISGDAKFLSPALPNMGQAELIRELMMTVAREPTSGLMHYPSRESFRPAREAVVGWLAGSPIGALKEEDIVLCHGGQNGISLAMQSILTGSKPVVLVEELAYPGFRRAAELLRAEVIPVPMDENGIIPEALEELARLHEAQALCTSCEVHNPTAIFTPEARRLQIAALAERYDFQIIEDDCYRMGPFRAPSYRQIAPHHGWYISSISKTLTPSLRIGYAIAPQSKGTSLRMAAENGFFGLAAPLGDLATLLLRDPRTKRMAERVREDVAKHVKCMVNHLGAHELRWMEDVPIAWLRLPQGWRAGSFCQAAADRGIKLRSAEDFTCRNAHAPHAVRIAINAQLPFDRFDSAMATLRALLDNPPERIGV